MTLTMVHSNVARIDHGIFRVDRKFHVGMQLFAKEIRRPLATVHPEMPAGQQIMDLIDVPCSELSYRVMTVKTDRSFRPLPEEFPRLREQISRSRLIYGTGLGSSRIARELKIPYILVLEYDLPTQITVSASQVTGITRRFVRTAKCTWHYAMQGIPDMRGAHSLHCNGYPIYDATRRYNHNRVLYLDSRMSADMLISRGELAARLAARAGRPFRLLFSGRYERMKGADHAVRVAVECLRRGLDIEMHFYGQGGLRTEMERIAAQASQPGRIHIHDAIPYTELATISRTFDLFVCCHIQSDPSCTYLESFGAGLPIIGYANRMWRRLNESSKGGLVSPLGDPVKVADDVEQLLADSNLVASMSVNALAFAEQHCFELEFRKRTDALNVVVG
jgi:colanic acid/amylovoran biosynthesis glycosyltransferase